VNRCASWCARDSGFDRRCRSPAAVRPYCRDGTGKRVRGPKDGDIARPVRTFCSKVCALTSAKSSRRKLSISLGLKKRNRRQKKAGRFWSRSGRRVRRFGRRSTRAKKHYGSRQAQSRVEKAPGLTQHVTERGEAGHYLGSNLTSLLC